MRFVRGELVAGEQPAHRVAPASALRQAVGGAAEGEDAAPDLNLREARVGRGDGDVERQAQLDAKREAAAVHGDHRRLLAGAA
jgi:hypothetical protein